jgi:pyruvate oxidase
LAGSEASSVLMAESDLVVIFGATWWPQAYTPPSARIVQIDAAKENIGMSHPVTRGLVGDLRAILPRFVELPKRSRELGSGDLVKERDAWLRRIAQVRSDWRQRIDEEAAPEGSPLAPQRVMRIISESVAADAIIALDTGDHTLWFNRVFENRGQRVLVSGRWRTLGFGLPAAIAAQLAIADRQVVAIAGDGGVVQTLMEFRTAVNLELPITLIVLNNGSYAIEKNRMELAGLSLMGSLLGNPDFAAIARACGGSGYAAATSEEFRSALLEALADRRPSLLEVSTAPLTVPHTKI